MDFQGAFAVSFREDSGNGVVFFQKHDFPVESTYQRDFSICLFFQSSLFLGVDVFLSSQGVFGYFGV